MDDAVITRRHPIRRALGPAVLTGAGLTMLAGAGVWWTLHRPPPPVEEANPNPRPVSVRREARVEPEPPPTMEVAARDFLPLPTERNLPIVTDEPVMPTTYNANTGPLVTRHSGQAHAAVSRGAAEPGPAAVTAAQGGVSYKPAQIAGHEAVVVGDLERVLKPFTQIPCTLSVAIDGNRGGYFRCSISRPVRSWGGQTNLLFAGDEISGTYQSLSTGDKRMTAAAAVATTRRGDLAMIVPLSGAPVTDAMGRGGMPGYVEQRGWLERLGNALLTDGTSSALRLPQQALRGQGGAGLQIDTSDTEQSVTRSIESAVNQAPVFRKNQGEEIAVLTTAPVRFGALRHEVLP